ncbi:lipoyl(octanoyl) transferase LipB [Methylonatrum kenyense]|uniref:lipoyl(octanoyl) transferase LipB n=1 Tax=Methylonatrum kenyense TaxID=455253 RepID=UPI0020C120FE|nr:lipoyl(octanoyl) transferase LipB [Methylonatrum kenyense]MCK8516547.1 lipoyl(octanoyl) transferase LipB [Methylonatrum kenyense]
MSSHTARDTRPQPPLLRRLGLRDYRQTWRAMQDFTDGRGPGTRDELWLVEHPPVFTLGLNGKPEHVLDAGDIPVVPVDRGGQVTYHGPGQVVLYTLLDVRRRGLGVRALVMLLEQAMIDLLAELDIRARARRDAPGVYVGDDKIGAIGLRVRRGASYHGLSLNVDMDLAPFERINPCGYPGLGVTRIRDQAAFHDASVDTVGPRLAERLQLLLEKRNRD